MEKALGTRLVWQQTRQFETEAHGDSEMNCYRKLFTRDQREVNNSEGGNRFEFGTDRLENERFAFSSLPVSRNPLKNAKLLFEYRHIFLDSYKGFRSKDQGKFVSEFITAPTLFLRASAHEIFTCVQSPTYQRNAH